MFSKYIGTFFELQVSQKRRSFVKNIPDLLSDDKEGKIMRNIDFLYFSKRASFQGNPGRVL